MATVIHSITISIQISLSFQIVRTISTHRNSSSAYLLSTPASPPAFPFLQSSDSHLTHLSLRSTLLQRAVHAPTDWLTANKQQSCPKATTCSAPTASHLHATSDTHARHIQLGAAASAALPPARPILSLTLASLLASCSADVIPGRRKFGIAGHGRMAVGAKAAKKSGF